MHFTWDPVPSCLFHEKVIAFLYMIFSDIFFFFFILNCWLQPTKLITYTLIGHNTQFEKHSWMDPCDWYLALFFGMKEGKCKLTEMEEERYGKMVKSGRSTGRNNGICEKGRKEHTVLRNVQHTISYAQCRIYVQ